jgi:hypothetical protein
MARQSSLNGRENLCGSAWLTEFKGYDEYQEGLTAAMVWPAKLTWLCCIEDLIKSQGEQILSRLARSIFLI